MFYIKEFLNNPGGKGSAVLNISAVKEKFIDRYEKIVKDIKHEIFIVKKDVYILVNIPSSVKGIFYDILVKFTNTPKSAGKSLADMSIQIFSNSPSFLYTYAHAYDKQGLFLNECKKKLSSQMLKDIAKSKNPYDMLSYDFSVFAALYFIVSNDYLSLDTINSYGTKTTKAEVLRHVKNAEVLQKDRKLQKTANKIEDDLNKKKIKKTIKKTENSDITNSEVNEIKNVKSVKKTKTVKTTKKVKKKG